MPQSPPTVRGAAIVQAAESVIVLAATILAGADAASGRSYHVNSGIALTVIGALAAVTLAWIALGLARSRRWSRTPALLTQLFVGIVGIYLLQARRLDWGIASVVLAVAGFALLFAPPSLRALTGTGQAAAADPQAQADDQQAAPGRTTPAGRKQQLPAVKPAPGRTQPGAGGRSRPRGANSQRPHKHPSGPPGSAGAVTRRR